LPIYPASERAFLVAWSFWRGISAQESNSEWREGALPRIRRPALATWIDKVPSDDRWIHEIKFDGYRVQLHIHNDAIKVFTRRGNDWTKRFSKIATDAYLIKAAARSSTARWSFRRQTARRTFPCCRTNCAASPSGSS
jgi:bifunctional non-homologous end joining protein LigD